jgi:hypothetical protein
VKAGFEINIYQQSPHGDHSSTTARARVCSRATSTIAVITIMLVWCITMGWSLVKFAFDNRFTFVVAQKSFETTCQRRID